MISGLCKELKRAMGRARHEVSQTDLSLIDGLDEDKYLGFNSNMFALR